MLSGPGNSACKLYFADTVPQYAACLILRVYDYMLPCKPICILYGTDTVPHVNKQYAACLTPLVYDDTLLVHCIVQMLSHILICSMLHV